MASYAISFGHKVTFGLGPQFNNFRVHGTVPANEFSQDPLTPTICYGNGKPFAGTNIESLTPVSATRPESRDSRFRVEKRPGGAAPGRGLDQVG